MATNNEQIPPHTMTFPQFNDLTPPFKHIHKKEDHIYVECQEEFWNMNSFLDLPFITSKTLYELFKNRCEKWPTEKCISFREKNAEHEPIGEYIDFNAQECLEKVDAIGSGLIQKVGMKKGDTVAIFSANRWEWLLTEYALYRHGIILVPLYATLSTDQLLYITETTKCNYVCCSDEMLPRIKEMKEMKDFKCVCFDSVVEGCADYCLKDIIEFGKNNIIPSSLPLISDICSIFFTSGTSGTPKGAIHTHSTITNAICCFGFSAPFHAEFNTRGQISYSYLPLAHVYEHQIDHTFLCTGGQLYISSGNIRYFAEEVKKASPTFLIVVPRVLQKLYDTFNSQIKQKPYVVQWLYNIAYYLKDWAMQTNTTNMVDWNYYVFNTIKSILGGRIQLICNGSAPLSREVYDWTRVCFDCIICNGYGSTETFGGCIGTIPGLQDPRIMSTGRPCPGAHFRLSDVFELGYSINDEPPRGEIEIKGEFIFKGYYGDEKSTSEAFTPDGWFKTGDIGCINEDGTISIIDRRKNMFKLSQGEYVAVEPLERMYVSSPLVQQFFIYGESVDSFIVGILVPEKDKLIELLRNKGIEKAVPDMRSEELMDLANEKECKDIILKELDGYVRSQGGKGYEIVKNIYVELQPFTEDNGLLTPSFKIRRQDVKKQYGDILQKLRKTN